MDEKKEIYSGPIRAEFALTAEDVKAALNLSGRLSSRTGLHLFQSALAVLGLAVFISSIVANPVNIMNYILAAFCLLLLGLIWVYPMISRRRAVAKTVDGRRMWVELESDRLHVCIPESNMDDVFMLTELPPVKQNDQIFLIELPEGALLALPRRSLPVGSEAAAAEILNKTGKPAAAPSETEQQKKDHPAE